jgi:CBS domain-containing protein
MNAGNFCARNVDTATSKETVLVAARRMNDRNVGSLVIVNDENRPIGIITDRDLTIRSLARSLEPTRTPLANVMTENPKVAPQTASLTECVGIMRNGPFRRLPIVDDSGELFGVLTLDDVLENLADGFYQAAGLIRREGPRVLGEE